jgi:hypothetical protein
MPDKIVKLDLRQDMREGREPYSKLMVAVFRLRKGEMFQVVAPSKPEPIFPFMASNGFSHTETVTPDGDWEVLFIPEDELPSPKVKKTSRSPADGKCSCGCGRALIEVDTCDFRKTPQPLTLILERLKTLPKDAELKARTRRRPFRLYAHLDERGFVGRTIEQDDGTFVTFIHHCENEFQR